jgi:hypothetical protein
MKARPPAGIILMILLALSSAVNAIHDLPGVWHDRTPGHGFLAGAEMVSAVVAPALALILWTRQSRFEPLLWLWGILMTFQATIASTIYSPADARLTAGFSSGAATACVLGVALWLTRQWLVRTDARG